MRRRGAGIWPPLPVRLLAAAVPGGELLSGKAFIPIDAKIRFRVTRLAEGSVNNKSFRFLPGVDYVDSEGVFEVLWHSGYIDKENR